MPSQRLSTSREQVPPYSSFPQEPSTPSSPPPPYTELDHRRAPRRFIPQDPRDRTSPPPPWPMTVPIIVITQAGARCIFKFCDRHATGASTYCRKHKCRAESCPAHKEIGAHSLYCSRHGCRWPRCDARAGGTARFCQTHKCRQASCPAARLSRTERSFCAFHACRQPESEFCGKHVYQANGSAAPKGHECAVQGCRAARTLHAGCCPRHQCEVRAQGPGSRYCGSHACARAGCPAVRKRGADHGDGQPPPREETTSGDAGLRGACQELRRLRLRPRMNIPARHGAGSPDGYCADEDDAFAAAARWSRWHATCAAEECLRLVARGTYCAHHGRPCSNPRFWTDERGADHACHGCVPCRPGKAGMDSICCARRTCSLADRGLERVLDRQSCDIVSFLRRGKS
ncbi:hypothetical protein F4775DRAFT_605497 [Biscogniauxia sp. FL1348]|nr:hypothetical protein F4775DRAFT_605497 [Biscogniauxia sp. FL1348]